MVNPYVLRFRGLNHYNVWYQAELSSKHSIVILLWYVRSSTVSGHKLLQLLESIRSLVLLQPLYEPDTM